MKRGFVKQHRKELESDIWLMPPLYNRVWKWILLKATWKKEIFPTPRTFGIHINPGQLITSYDIIANGVKWFEWGKERIPNKKTIKTILDWLKENKMIALESNAKGTFIYVINWSIYQEEPRAESNANGTTDKRLLETLKEVKELKKKIELHKEKINKKEKAFSVKDFRPDWFPEKDWNDLILHRRKKKAAETERAYKSLLKEFQIAMNAGVTLQHCIDKMAQRNWTGFEAEWILKDKGGNGRPKPATFRDQKQQEKTDIARKLIESQNQQRVHGSPAATAIVPLP